MNYLTTTANICKKAPRGLGLYKVNCSLLEDPLKLIQAKAQIDTMMQQLDPTWNPHQKLVNPLKTK